MHPDNIVAGNKFGLRHGFKVCTGAHYPGIFIGYVKSKRDCLADQTSKWEKNMCVITKTAGKLPQNS